MKTISLIFLSIFYIFAGINHFVQPKLYLKMMPPYLPAHLQLVYLSGAAEFILGVLLWFPASRPFAAWGIILLLIAVFPANIYMCQQGEAVFKIPQWALYLRLPIQGLLIGWAYLHT